MTAQQVIITEVETIDGHEEIRKDLKRIAVAYNMLEIVDKTIQIEEKNDEVFDVLTVSLKALEKSSNLKKLRENFIYEILVTLGFWPKGRELNNHDTVLEEILEKKVSSVRVGKIILR